MILRDCKVFTGEEAGCASKLVYSYVKGGNNGYILAKKGLLAKGDRVSIHGSECIITNCKRL